MSRVLLVSLLVALALPMGVAGSPTAGTGSAGSVPSLQDVAILTLDDGSRTSIATGSTDVATALTIQHDAAAVWLDQYALAERFRAADTAEARKDLLFESSTDVRFRIATLRDEEQSLRSAYAARDIDTETFGRQLVRIHARSGALRARLESIRRHADMVPEFSMDGRVQVIQAGLAGLEGPVRDRMVTAVVGGSAIRFSVTVTETGVVLSTIDDGLYVREAYRSDHLDPQTVRGTTFGEAVTITEQLYAPYAYNQSLTVRNELIGPAGGIFRFTMELRNGLVIASLDSATRNVFFEVQERRLDLIESRPSVVGAANGTQLVVNRSFPGGPLRISVADNETGQPRSTTVVVDGTRLETAADGTAWTLAPGGSFEVTAIGPRGNVTVSARPLAPTPVHGDG